MLYKFSLLLLLQRTKLSRREIKWHAPNPTARGRTIVLAHVLTNMPLVWEKTGSAAFRTGPSPPGLRGPPYLRPHCSAAHATKLSVLPPRSAVTPRRNHWFVHWSLPWGYLNFGTMLSFAFLAHSRYLPWSASRMIKDKDMLIFRTILYNGFC